MNINKLLSLIIISSFLFFVACSNDQEKESTPKHTIDPSGENKTTSNNTTKPNIIGEIEPPVFQKDTTGGEGTIIGNSGHMIALRFSIFASKAVKLFNNEIKHLIEEYQSCLRENLEIGLPELCKKPPLDNKDLQKIQLALQTARVYAVENRLCPKAKPNCSEEESLVAVNLPAENTIFVNIQKWNEAKDNEKIYLAFHEHLGLAELEVDNYYHTTFILLVRSIILDVEYTIDYFYEEMKNYNIANIEIDRNLLSNQESFKEIASTTMDCFSLIEAKHPGKLYLHKLGLNTVSHPDGATVDSGHNHEYQYSIQFYLNLNLQVCYNFIRQYALLENNSVQKPCSTVDKMEVGMRCHSLKGHTIELLAKSNTGLEIWHDHTLKTYWTSSLSNTPMDQESAQKSCIDLKKSLDSEGLSKKLASKNWFLPSHEQAQKSIDIQLAMKTDVWKIFWTNEKKMLRPSDSQLITRRKYYFLKQSSIDVYPWIDHSWSDSRIEADTFYAKCYSK